MAKIYLSYQHQDTDLILQISKKLIDKGHEVIMDSTVMKIGRDWRADLLNELKSSDGVLVLITENSLNSKYVISEIGTTRALLGDNDKFLIPVIKGNFEVPDFIKDIYCLRLDDNNLDLTIEKIDTSIVSFQNNKLVKDDERKKKIQLIESKAADYIKESTKNLTIREKHNKYVAYICYLAGFISLTAGVYFAINGLYKFSETQNNLDNDKAFPLTIIIIILVKSIIIIGLLVACSKYTFTLGKSFMHESLRNSDRIHAISFGEFFIKAFGDKISSYKEITEIFQNWNIDKSSSFYEMDTKTYDPNFSENLVEIIKSLSDKIQK